MLPKQRGGGTGWDGNPMSWASTLKTSTLSFKREMCRLRGTSPPFFFAVESDPPRPSASADPRPPGVRGDDGTAAGGGGGCHIWSKRGSVCAERVQTDPERAGGRRFRAATETWGFSSSADGHQTITPPPPCLTASVMLSVRKAAGLLQIQLCLIRTSVQMFRGSSRCPISVSVDPCLSKRLFLDLELWPNPSPGTCRSVHLLFGLLRRSMNGSCCGSCCRPASFSVQHQDAAFVVRL